MTQKQYNFFIISYSDKFQLIYIFDLNSFFSFFISNLINELNPLYLSNLQIFFRLDQDLFEFVHICCFAIFLVCLQFNIMDINFFNSKNIYLLFVKQVYSNHLFILRVMDHQNDRISIKTYLIQLLLVIFRQNLSQTYYFEYQKIEVKNYQLLN